MDDEFDVATFISVDAPLRFGVAGFGPMLRVSISLNEIPTRFRALHGSRTLVSGWHRGNDKSCITPHQPTGTDRSLNCERYLGIAADDERMDLLFLSFWPRCIVSSKPELRSAPLDGMSSHSRTRECIIAKVSRPDYIWPATSIALYV